MQIFLLCLSLIFFTVAEAQCVAKKDTSRPVQISFRCGVPRSGNTPLLIVDGNLYKGSLSDLKPNDIEQIEIMKGSEAEVIWGRQAEYGVVLIATKHGKDAIQIIDAISKLPVANVTITVLQKDTISLVTDEEGRAMFPSRLRKVKATVVITSTGYKPVSLLTTQNILQTVQLYPDYTALPEVLIVDGGSRTIRCYATTCGKISTTKNSQATQKAQPSLSADLKLYPNPAKSGSELKILASNAYATIDQVSLYTISGQQVRTAQTTGGHGAYAFRLPSVRAGSYVVKVTLAGKAYMHQLMIY